MEDRNMKFWNELMALLRNNTQYIFENNNDAMMVFQVLHKTLLTEQEKGI